MEETRYLVLANARAGSLERAALETATKRLEAAGSVEVVQTRTKDEVDSVINHLDGHTFVIAGGDGTLHVGLSALWRAGALGSTPVGILPLGTGNDFARALGLPLTPLESAGVIAGGKQRRISIIEDSNGGIVINAVHLGIGARASALATRHKPRLGTTAYPLGALMAGVSCRGWDLSVVADGVEVYAGKSLVVHLGNGTSIGGGTWVTPEADLEDDVIDVVVATCTGPLARLGYARALRAGRHHERHDVEIFQAREITVGVRSGPGAPVNADGELELITHGRTWTLAPRCWDVFVP